MSGSRPTLDVWHDGPAVLGFLLRNVIVSQSTPSDLETTDLVLNEAARFAEDRLRSAADAADRLGCRLSSGRVKMPEGHLDLWHAFAGAGWLGLSSPETYGGSGGSLRLDSAVQELFDAAHPALGMLALDLRSAARLLAVHAPDIVRDQWMPELVAGRWAATICVSEPHAGSDVGRLRTRATQKADGRWSVDGEKCWISFGDHDLCARIGHVVLARPAGAAAGSGGLSLFLVPNVDEHGGSNGVAVTRLEEKLGLHGSPTCGLLFSDAAAIPIGPPGRGLPTLFAMIRRMRLGVAVQGAAVAQASAKLAETYAATRLQGGPTGQPALPIYAHADVRRLLLRGRLRAEIARLIALQAAAWLEDGEAGDDGCAAAAALVLPIAKTFGAEAAFENADDAIQVLGGAGYVRDWPAERMLRDARVFSIYEGTTAMQANDLTMRRLTQDRGAGLRDVLSRLQPSPDLQAIVIETAEALCAAPDRRRELAAVAFLHLVGLACADGLLRRAANAGGPIGARYAALATFQTSDAHARAERLAARCRLDDLDDAFDHVFDPHARQEPVHGLQ